MTDRTKPKLSREGFPEPPDVVGVNCPCGAYYDRRTDLDSEVEDINDMTSRVDYFCPDCDEHLGTRTDYHGPIPVEIGAGIYELQ